MNTIKQIANGWMLTADELVIRIDGKTGCLTHVRINHGKGYDWAVHPGDVVVRDDLLRRTFDRRDLKSAAIEKKDDVLSIRKMFRGAPWRLEETYRCDPAGAIHWEAQVVLSSGEFRSCAVTYQIPWPASLDDFFGTSFWAAKDGMPSAPHRFASLALEYGEITSGILLPALAAYQEKRDAGLLLCMPFDFKTPRLRFVSGYREPDLRVEFDWLALSPGKPARTHLVLRGTGGAWRPALGWFYEQYREYFEPRSTLIHDLWGGHVCGGCEVSPEQARQMARLGLRWHEIHMHFPAYGNYHPEGRRRWKSEHREQFDKWITVDMVRRTIRNLHAVGAAALPYIQVSGDGAAKGLDPAFAGSRVRDRRGGLTYIDIYDVYEMNSDPALPFGKDITRQIRGMVKRYPEMDGVFLDQACYNWADTAHDDGITAIDNRPASMTGFNYEPHLELLSSLLHPAKAIIGNAPYCVGMMKYIDGFMAEGSGWLCDHLQYYAIAKPMFFLMYESGDRDIELMFQRCLLYGAGYTSYAAAMPSRDLYEQYTPLLKRLFRRRWVFDPRPISVPTGFKGNVFRAPGGNLLASVVSEEPRLDGRRIPDNSVIVRVAEAERVRRVTLQQPGGKIVSTSFGRENGAVQFKLPGRAIAAVAELHLA